MKKVNCWEFKQCGREPGGAKKDQGVCPAAMDPRLHGTHGGRRAGRACWVIAGTKCGGREQGVFAKKYHDCDKCDFYKMVKIEEGFQYVLSINLLKRLDDRKHSVPKATLAAAVSSP